VNVLSDIDSLPIIDISGLVKNNSNKSAVAEQIGKACRESGFFYVSHHGVSEALQKNLKALSQEFFRLPSEQKMKIAMIHGKKAWRGFFPVGGELTSGLPDIKEGIYFGQELPRTDSKVIAGIPLHGPNLFPDVPRDLKPVVLDYIQAMTHLGHTIMSGIALSLGLAEDHFQSGWMSDPLVLFRIFNYPAPSKDDSPASWGVGEHTDYGILTILNQDENGGLEVKTKSGWIQAPPIPHTFVCNLGDMLDRLTGGRYKSTPHRVKNGSGKDRLSFPFFFDPNFDARVQPLPMIDHQKIQDDSRERWDRANVHAFTGTYGQYLLGKVIKVFPELGGEVLS
jgi:isopenicillin N synthase-like dioxygenase